MTEGSGRIDRATGTPPASDAVTRGDWRTEVATTTVVRAVAAATDTPAGDLPPLAAVIDPDALDALFTPDAPADRALTFAYADHRVTVTGSGRVLLEPVDD